MKQSLAQEMLVTRMIFINPAYSRSMIRELESHFPEDPDVWTDSLVSLVHLDRNHTKNDVWNLCIFLRGEDVPKSVIRTWYEQKYHLTPDYNQWITQAFTAHMADRRFQEHMGYSVMSDFNSVEQ